MYVSLLYYSESKQMAVDKRFHIITIVIYIYLRLKLTKRVTQLENGHYKLH